MQKQFGLQMNDLTSELEDEDAPIIVGLTEDGNHELSLSRG